MSTSTLAIPSALPGGLEAGMGMHFGHCDIYTIVQIEDGAIKSVGTLPNVPHQQGGCLAPQIDQGGAVQPLLFRHGPLGEFRFLQGCALLPLVFHPLDVQSAQFHFSWRKIFCSGMDVWCIAFFG